MGFVWNVMLSFDSEEFWEEDEDEPRETCEPLERINDWLGQCRLVSLVGPTYEDDAGNGMDANLYGGGFKHFDIDSFIDIVNKQTWKKRANVQLWVKGAEEGMGADPWALVKLNTPQRDAAKKAATTRKRRAAGRKAAETKKRKTAARKAVATRKTGRTKR